ncbi:hypothetical protein ACIOFY_37065 [Streptomyces anulatus]
MTHAEIEVPGPDEGAVKPWRKWLKGLDERQYGGGVCEGEWLDAGAAYALPIGAIVVLCDPQPGGEKKRVRIWRIKKDGTFKEERDSVLGARNAFGTSVRGTMRRLLDKHPAGQQTWRRLTAAPVRVNEREDSCELCRQAVAAGAGILVRDGSGYSRVRHQPGTCPPPPPRLNEWAQECGKCGGWLEIEEGVLYEAGTPVAPATRARHREDCPPAEERKAPPPRVNGREQECERCGHLVPAGSGELLRAGSGWVVRHPEGNCLPREELWQIDRGVPGRFHPRPERWRNAGTVLRSEVFEGREQPFPDTAPGYRRVRDGVVSAIVTTVRELPPVYCRDEDGNNPGCLIGEDGWYFRILVRPANAEEAAGILAAEEENARRYALDERRRAAFSYRAGDGEVPDDVDGLGDAQPVDFGAEARRRFLQHWPDDELRVDEAAGVVWFLEYNGADGDDWSRNNVSSFVAQRFPLTEERRRLITDLRAEYQSE